MMTKHPRTRVDTPAAVNYHCVEVVQRRRRRAAVAALTVALESRQIQPLRVVRRSE